MIEHELGNWKDFIEGMLRKALLNKSNFC
ncbi:hypothetical protein C4Z03_026795 [Klebsiella pneumoniae subsp. pneumoniae]|nr:hypothetical protein C4Z03_026795 [Klebsiella pneumoniae subsp. pneumoniae]